MKHALLKTNLAAALTVSFALMGFSYSTPSEALSLESLGNDFNNGLDTFEDFVEKKIDKIVIAGGKAGHKPVDYLARLPASIAADVCSAPVQFYEKVVRGQVGGWRSLPPAFINAAQQFYSVDLSGVQYAVGVRTSNGQAQTFGNRIYFPSQINLNDIDDVYWMLHELEHVVQYAGASFGFAGKLCEYIAKGVGSGFQHDRIDWERAADRKADYAADFVMRAMQQGNGAGASWGRQAVASMSQPIKHPVNVSFPQGGFNGPRMSNVCGPIQGGYCTMPMQGPVGAPCQCFSNFGQSFPGQIR